MKILPFVSVCFHGEKHFIWEFSKLENGILLLLFYQEAIVLIFTTTVFEFLCAGQQTSSPGRKNNILEYFRKKYAFLHSLRDHFL